jgi:hypothetical protein
MSMLFYFVLSCLDGGIADDRSPAQEALPNIRKIHKFKLNLNKPRNLIRKF